MAHPRANGRAAPPAGLGVVAVVALVIVVLAAVSTAGVGLVLLVKAGEDVRQDFTNGAQVTPHDDLHTVYVSEEPARAIRCTGRTTSGETLLLAPSEGRPTIARGTRPMVIYYAIAELPTDRGSITVTCDTTIGSLYLFRPNNSPRSLTVVALLIVPALVLVAAALVVRRTLRG